MREKLFPSSTKLSLKVEGLVMVGRCTAFVTASKHPATRMMHSLEDDPGLRLDANQYGNGIMEWRN